MSEHNPDGGQDFRQAWIDGVNQYYPGEPKPGYVRPWSRTPEWEQKAAAAVYRELEDVLSDPSSGVLSYSRQEKGAKVCELWIEAVKTFFPDAPAGYLAKWEDLPSWQQETDSDIFETVQRAVSTRTSSGQDRAPN